MKLDDAQLEGFDDLGKALSELKAATSTKAIRQSANSSLNPVVQRMRQRAPRGSRAHRTYKGRLVAPGFLSRSIKKRSRVDARGGRVVVTVGVAKEAFYGLFYDRGFSRKRGARVAGNSWFVNSFLELSDETQVNFSKGLRSRINKVKSKTR